jgi:hypothetical protein
VTVTQLNPKTAYATYGNENDPVFVGRELPKYPHFYHERFIYLVHHETALMSGHMGIIHSKCVLFSGSLIIFILYNNTHKHFLCRLSPRECRH